MSPESHPLSLPQQAIYLDALLSGPTAKFNMGGGIVIRGALDADLFRQGIEFAFRHHDAQRMRIRVEGGEARQQFVTDAACAFECKDFSGQADPFESAIDWLLADFRRPASEGEFPLCRDVLFRLGGDLHLWYPRFHHIANDGFGHAVVARTVAAAYNSLLANGRLPELEARSYVDFLREDRAYAASARFREDQDFWERKFASLPEPLPFTARKPYLPEGRIETGQCTLGLHRLVYNALLRVCEEIAVTPFQFLLAALATYLHRATGRDDMVIGTPILNRSNHAFRSTAGMFMNMMPLRIVLAREATVLGLARQIAAELRACYRHQRFPLAEILRHCRTREGFCGAVYDVTLVYRKLDYDIRFGGSTARTVTLDPQVRDETLSIEVDEYHAEEEVNLSFNYDPRLISREQAAQMASGMEALLVEVAVAGDRPAREMPSAAQAAGSTLCGEALAAHGRPLPDRIREHAGKRPSDAAVLPTAQYGQLQRLVALRRGQLRALGLQGGAVLAVGCAAGCDWTGTVLAALAEGITVLPVDPQAPAERLAYMLQDAGAALLWHDRCLAAAGDLPCPLLDCAAAPLASPVTGPSAAGPRATAYILYTSGTTGRPKGVRVSQAAFEAHCRSAIAAYGLHAGDRVLVFAPPHFDAAWEQLFAPLAAGAAVLIRGAEMWSAEECCRRMMEAGITVADLPPQYLRELLYFLEKRPECAPGELRLMICGGEALPSSLAAAWLAGPLGHVPLVNAYGPTEGVVTSTWHRVEAGARVTSASGVTPIGRPMPGRQLWILNAGGGEAGEGEAGELCIGGICLADGYHGDEQRTRDAFRYWLPTPLGGRWAEAGTPGAVRCYRSGDRVRRAPDGLLEFLGRIDRQIKIRGFRVEPAEVEAALAQHPAVAQAVVAAVDERLAAWCVPAGNSTPSRGELAQWLAGRLPEFMVPAAITFLPRFPVTDNGKIDTAALPQAEFPAASRPARSELEMRIAAIWAEVLGRPEVGLDDNFFDIGGHSLLLVRVHTRLADELGAQVTLVDLFAHPTVARTARLLGGQVRENVPRPPRAAREGVAVIGMAGRFPGARNVEELWDNLVHGRESIHFFSERELAEAGVPPELRGRPDYVPAHGCLDGVRQFDAGFFGYTPKEAELIDPQQRLFLEEAWHALEDAGCDPSRHPGDIAVFAGMGMSHYLLDHLSPRLRQDRAAETYAVILANDKDFLTARVSYKLGLRGPSVNVNTACSTSLVAVHLAAEALLRGECDVALAGGVTLQVSDAGHVHQTGGIASPDGHCRPFAEDAAGTVGASGVAVVVLKRLDAALRDGDPIRAVIKGSAVNNDGSDKVGFTAPGVHRQRDVIRAALDSAGVRADSIQYVEAHGTGTAMGDPIEIQALCEAYAPDQPAPQSCRIGSVKSNLGHLDTAAGVTGLVKTVLALEHRQIPPTLHCEQPSSRIGFEHTPFRVAQALEAWPEKGPRRAGVSSFGMGGTNAHVVLEEAPEAVAPAAPRQDVWCLPISARSTKSLREYAEKLARHLEAHPEIDALDLWFTLSEGRKRFPVRAVVLAPSRTAAAAGLRELRENECTEGEEFAAARAFAAAWLTGEQHEASRLLPAGSHRRIPLPGYCFEHEIYWVEANRRPVSEWLYYPRWESLPRRHGAGPSMDAQVPHFDPGGKLWRRTLAPLPVGDPAPDRLTKGGVYVLTGALGNAARTLAAYLTRTWKAEVRMDDAAGLDRVDGVIHSGPEPAAWVAEAGIRMAIEWGPWEDSMTSEEVIEVFLRALATDEPMLAVNPGHPQPAEPRQTPLRARPELATAFREPDTESEKLIAAIWQEVLGYSRIGADDDLFDLGADSLTALQVSHRLEERTGQRISMEQFFDSATIASLAGALARYVRPVAAGVPDEATEDGEL